MAVQSREFNVVVYGATSTTARYTVRRLIEMKGVKFAVAGRNVAKLQQMMQSFGAEEVPIREAQLTAPSMNALCITTDVIVNFAGPYFELADVVVDAAVEQGTHYIDASGEMPWCARLQNSFSKKAAENNVMIMPCAAAMFAPAEILWANAKETCSLEVWKSSQVELEYDYEGNGLASGTLNTILSHIRNAPPNDIAERLKDIAAAVPRSSSLFWPRRSFSGQGFIFPSLFLGNSTMKYLTWYDRLSPLPMHLNNVSVGVHRDSWLTGTRAFIKEVISMFVIAVLATMPPSWQESCVKKMAFNQEDMAEKGNFGVKLGMKNAATGQEVRSTSLTSMHGSYELTGYVIAEAAAHICMHDFGQTGGLGNVYKFLGKGYVARLISEKVVSCSGIENL